MKAQYARQRKFLRGVLKSQGIDLDVMTHRQKIEVTKEYLLCLHKELAEVLDELDWKSHRKLDQLVVGADGLAEEFVDVQKYLWNLAHLWELNYHQYSEALDRKTYVVEERWRMEKNELDVPAVACDIDEVLFEWTDSFSAWVIGHHPELLSIRKGRNPLEWERVKKEYRESGAKSHGTANVANIRSLRKFRTMGCSIVLLTYRPRKITPNLEYDTLKWIEANDVPCDKLYWASNSKSVYMAELLRSCSVFIDDDREACASVASIGRSSYWLTSSFDDPPVRCVKVASVEDVYQHRYECAT